MGGCQNYGPFLGTLNNRRRIILGTQKGTLHLSVADGIRKKAVQWPGVSAIAQRVLGTVMGNVSPNHKK